MDSEVTKALYVLTLVNIIILVVLASVGIFLIKATSTALEIIELGAETNITSE